MSDPTCGGADGRGAIDVRLVPTKIPSSHVCGHTTPGNDGDTTILVYLPCVMSLAESLHLGSAARPARGAPLGMSALDRFTWTTRGRTGRIGQPGSSGPCEA